NYFFVRQKPTYDFFTCLEFRRLLFRSGLVPLLAILLTPRSVAVPSTVGAVVLALMVTGSVSAHVGGASKRRAVARVVVGGLAAMGVTYGIGLLVGSQV